MRPGTIPTVATITPIDDPADPRVDDFRDLTTADRRPDRPGGRGLVIAEGVVVVRRLLDSPLPGALAARRAAAARRAGGRPRRARRARVRHRRRHDGRRRRVPPQPRRARGRRPGAPRRRWTTLLRTARRRWRCWRASTTTRTSARCSATPRRSASTRVLLGPRCADPLYRRSVRVSMGHVLRVPFAALPGPWPASLDLLRDRGLRVVALTPAPDARAAAAPRRLPGGSRCCSARRARA